MGAVELASMKARIVADSGSPGDSVIASLVRAGGYVLPGALALVAVFALRRHVLGALRSRRGPAARGIPVPAR